MIHQPKVMLQKRINNIYIWREREREYSPLSGEKYKIKWEKKSIKYIYI